MVEKSDQIRNQIDAQRGELGENLHELERRVKGTTDWRAHMEKRPWIMLGLAFGAGFTISGLMGRSGSSSSAYSSYSSSSYPETPARGSSAHSSSRFANFRAQRHRAADSLDRMTGALVAVGVQKLQDVLSSAIPGFRDKLDSSEPSDSGRMDRQEAYSGSDSRAQNSFDQSPTPAL